MIKRYRKLAFGDEFREMFCELYAICARPRITENSTFETMQLIINELAWILRKVTKIV